MEKNKQQLLEDKKFLNKMEKYSDLYYTVSEFDGGRFQSFYTAVFETKHHITDHFADYLEKMDDQLEEFKWRTERKANILKGKIQKEYQLNDEEFDDIHEEYQMTL